ncbi:MAG: NAD-dependent DNA ligase LigA [Candidatus Paceibacterota bacterium]
MEKLQAEERIEKLRKLIEEHRFKYHVKDEPSIADEAYDSLKEELAALEAEYPELDSPTSPTHRVGGEPLEGFRQIEHTIRQYSFDNIFSAGDLADWQEKLTRFVAKAGGSEEDISYLAELKIDGLKVILTYEAGQLVQAATRGDGRVGEDVTANIKTISAIPLDLFFDIDVVIAGEVWLSQTEFSRINREREESAEAQFANPRNAAAGSIRQLDPAVAAARRLDFFAYDIEEITTRDAGIEVPDSQLAELELLSALHFRVNPDYVHAENVAVVQDFYNEWTEKRSAVDYGVDGVVIKLNSKELQDELGYTASAPRWAIAYKFPAETTTTTVEDIQLQVGRTGAITPVAHLEPTLLDGSTVTRATLHNEDEIRRLDVRVGDTVIIKKAGDIIPQVVEVLTDLRGGKEKPYKFPQKLSACGGDGTIIRPEGEAKHRCKFMGDSQRREEFYHFVSKGCFDIDGLGPKLIDQLLEHELITDFSDIFTLKKADLVELPRMADKSVDNLLKAIKEAREVSLDRFLSSLSISYVGAETSRLIAQHLQTIAAVRAAGRHELREIDGVGEKVAEAVESFFAADDNQELVDRLLREVEIMEMERSNVSNKLAGKIFVFTGSLDNLTRTEAAEAVRARGGKVASSVSSNTDYVVAGDNPGSKRAEAENLGVDILTETDFKKLLA